MAPGFEIAAGVALVAMAGGFAVLRYRGRRIAPEELERRRRLTVNATGKTGSGEVVDVDGGSIVFRYVAGGMEFTASQDISGVGSLLPADRMSIVGPASVKFDPRNPANSIVICEEWSGLRAASARKAAGR
jgi:hypothetical protein